MEFLFLVLIWALPVLFIAFVIDQIWGPRAAALRELAKVYAGARSTTTSSTGGARS
jgi:hypothetical protein